MRHIAILALFWTAPVVADVSELVLKDGGRIELSIASGVSATLARAGDWVTLSGPGERESRFEVPLFSAWIDRQAGFIKDIDGDGFRDLLIRTDIGYGGVNLFHDIVMYRDGTGWVNVGTVSNPEFVAGLDGFTASGRSGPVWSHELWDLGPDGTPYLQRAQTITFGGFELRETFTPDQLLLERIIVAEGSDLTTVQLPVQAIIGPEGASAQSPDPDGMAMALWLEPGRAVTLRDWDEMSNLVLVETADGVTAWIDAEALILP